MRAAVAGARRSESERTKDGSGIPRYSLWQEEGYNVQPGHAVGVMAPNNNQVKKR